MSHTQTTLPSLSPPMAGVEPSKVDEVRYERKMGDSELSYYLPSRDNGVNDMYLHLGFKSPRDLVTRARVSTVWATLRLRHPFLASHIEMHSYDDVRFVYRPPQSPVDALIQAENNLEYQSTTKDELIDTYLNGARILANDRLSYLIISPPPSSVPASPVTSTNESSAEQDEQDVDILICVTHYIGDGMALHQFAHDFFTLLGSKNTVEELQGVLGSEWAERWGIGTTRDSVLPSSLEEAIPEIDGRFRRAATKVDFDNSQSKLIGGHSFLKRSSKVRRTIVPTISFDEVKTKAMLKTCKAHGVSISAALFALCNIVWSRMRPNNPELPMMMYSALNLRPLMPKPPPSYWFLAVGYFNVVLPTFIPKALPTSQVFWHRARSAKDQSTRAAKNPMIVHRTQEMARERGTRSRAWAKEDDEKANGTWVEPAPPPFAPKPASKPPPSNVLIGLSLLGNLDGIYKHQDFQRIKMHTLTTGSRQRNGAMLLFGYTFAGKLWLSLGYDEEGFEEETVVSFWKGLEQSVDEFLVQAA